MVNSLVHWLYERPDCPLPLPRGLQRTSRHATPSNCRPSTGQGTSNAALPRCSSQAAPVFADDIEAPTQPPTSTPFQLPRTSSQSMDVDCPARAPESEPNEPTVPTSQFAVPPLPTPSGPQSTTAPISLPGQQLPSRPPLSYVAVTTGAQSPTTSAPSTAALAAILDHVQTVLQAFV